MKKLLYSFILLTLTLLVYFNWQVWENNRDVVPLSQAEIKQHFDRSVDWLESNYSSIENIQTPIIMVDDETGRIKFK